MDYNSFEYFVIKKIKVVTDIDECHFAIPSNDSLTYHINDICRVLYNQIENGVNNNYLIELSRSFYVYLEKETVLREIDSLAYSKLLILSKEISEGKNINKKATLEYFSRIRNKYKRQYLAKIIDKILSFKSNFEANLSKIDAFVDLFLNELLSRGVDVRFIQQCVKWFERERFTSIKSLLMYFLESNSDNYDVYLPVKGLIEKNHDIFEQAEQEIIEKNGQSYLHVFKNQTIDYFSVIRSHMTRIESIFNMLKLYTRSSISFDLESDIIVEINSDVLGAFEENFPFSRIIKYMGVKPFSRFMKNTLDNLYSLESGDKTGYHKILNIIAYSEKDDDLINPTSYVDAWIALETLYSLSEMGKGLDVVKKLLPMFLSSKVILNRLTFYLSHSFRSQKCKAEDFILKKQDLKKVSDIYYRYELSKMESCFSNLKSLSKLYEAEEQKMQTNLLRIYMLRNEYVHESNLNAFTSLQFYYLKNYLTMSIDVFFGMFDKLLSGNFLKEEKLIYVTFQRLIQKNEDRKIAFEITNKTIKYNNGNCTLVIDEVDKTINQEEMILNILLNNITINKKFKKYDKNEDY